ncbi:uncharacterized membrane protein YcaP (DUF421 family) [Scopulibacillus darangshiensis]|uniref:Uncharacterized membrane protein YcaP (DUF421 family) n=1 Tax=Scopulibacillus darangshiensis TaxID=442528 RepID=A0A4R2NXY6_9BACL|nr:DUF421 domain-containing protein [Scopulibacillus darangshiensis]TCP27040.1 uncharacterized membrane protein YcaP (DUF421 family) [Scopulibacillus darangshiensis]
MLLFIGKAMLLYILTIIAIRLMGKTAFAQLTAHDLTGIFFVATLAIGPLVTRNFTYAIVAVFMIAVLHIVFSKLMLFNLLNQTFIGHPTIVIKHGKIVKENLKRSRFTLAGLLSGIREKGYPDLAVIEYALLEPNGEISVFPKQTAAPVTPIQLGIKPEYQGLPIAVIIEGKIQQRNLSLINKDEQWLMNELKKEGYKDHRRIFYAAIRDNHQLLTIDNGDGDKAATDDK